MRRLSLTRIERSTGLVCGDIPRSWNRRDGILIGGCINSSCGSRENEVLNRRGDEVEGDDTLGRKRRLSRLANGFGVSPWASSGKTGHAVAVPSPLTKNRSPRAGAASALIRELDSRRLQYRMAQSMPFNMVSAHDRSSTSRCCFTGDLPFAQKRERFVSLCDIEGRA